MLAAANQEYDNQQRLAALAVIEAQRLATRGSTTVARSVQQYQAAAVELSLETLAALLAEQGISQAADGAVEPLSLLTAGDVLVSMLDATGTPAALARLVQTLVGDAGRTARAVDGFTRPAVTGYIRSLRPPSCKRCVILAGRVYRHSTGFERHPQDDCLMTPTNQTIGPHLVTDPLEVFEKGWIKDLSQADIDAVHAADGGAAKRDALTHRVNLQRPRSGGKKHALSGMSVGSSVIPTVGSPNPQQLLESLTNRIDAFAALRQAGFITAA